MLNIALLPDTDWWKHIYLGERNREKRKKNRKEKRRTKDKKKPKSRESIYCPALSRTGLILNKLSFNFCKTTSKFLLYSNPEEILPLTDCIAAISLELPFDFWWTYFTHYFIPYFLTIFIKSRHIAPMHSVSSKTSLHEHVGCGEPYTC